MQPERMEKIKKVFLEALERVPEARLAFIDEICVGDLELKEKVKALLAKHEKKSVFLDKPIDASIFMQTLDCIEDIQAPEEEPDLPFERLGEFRLIRRLGGGGMGDVYLALQESMNRNVALKVIRMDRSGSMEVEIRFWREVEAISKLSHQNIVTVYGSGIDNEIRYIAMEHLPGNDLDQVLRDAVSRKQRIPLIKGMGWIKEIAGALSYAHQAGIIHRDVKPSNIRIAPDDHAKLMDFGVARLIKVTALTLTGQFRGTPHYASPEQIKGRSDDIDERTDVYSLGVTLYEVVTGRLPFVGDSTDQVFHQILETDPIQPRVLYPAVSRDLNTIIVTAMEKDPTRRYQTMADFENDLARTLNGEVILAKHAGPITKVLKKIKRNPVLSGALGITLLAIISWVLFGPLLYLNMLNERNRAQKAETEAKGLQEEVEESFRKGYEDIYNIKQLTRLEDKVNLLWPANQEKVDVFDKWIQEATQFAGLLEVKIRELEEIRNNAFSYDDETRKLDRETHPSWRLLQLLKKRLFDIKTTLADKNTLLSSASNSESDINISLDELKAQIMKLEERIARVSKRIELIGSMVNQRRTWNFNSSELNWRHENLTEIVAKLVNLTDKKTGLIRQIKDRFDYANTVYDRTYNKFQNEWKHAIATIGDQNRCPAYKGLSINPQLGFVPLGQDPQSGLWEFAHIQSGKIPIRDLNGKLLINEDTGMVFILVPGGSYNIGAIPPNKNNPQGSPNVDPQAEADESPVCKINIEPFFMSKYEMTQGQWFRIMYNNPSRYGPDEKYGDKQHNLTHPVEQVSWSDCMDILSKLELRLPSEAEWEYCARAATETVYWTGNEAKSLEGAVNICDITFKNDGGYPGWKFYDEWIDDGYARHAPVHMFRPNPFGFHNIAGNVSEWCMDSYSASYEGTPRDGSAWKSDNHSLHAVRGGDFYSNSSICRSSNKDFGQPETSLSRLGVRPAKSIQ